MNNIASYIVIVAGIMLWTPLLGGRHQPGHRMVEGITIFGGAFLFASCFINLVPHIYLQGYTTPEGLKVGAAVMLGFFMQLLLEQLTGGVEHGHKHHEHHDRCHFDENCICKEESHSPQVHALEHHPEVALQDTLPATGLLVGLCLHSFLEGMPMAEANGEVHQGLLWGIVLHNIPITLVLIGIFVANGIKPLTATLLLLLFAVMAPLGSIFNLAFVTQNPVVQCIIMGVVVGILLHVSVSILFGENHNRLTWKKLLLIMLAFAAAYFTPGCPDIY